MILYKVFVMLGMFEMCIFLNLLFIITNIVIMNSHYHHYYLFIFFWQVKCLVCGTESKKYDPFLGEWYDVNVVACCRQNI